MDRTRVPTSDEALMVVRGGRDSSLQRSRIGSKIRQFQHVECGGKNITRLVDGENCNHFTNVEFRAPLYLRLSMI